MDIGVVQRINRLWRSIYPYLVAQIMDSYQRNYGSVLELGPFSGGISLELARLYPAFDITIADESPAMTEHFKNEIATSRLKERIAVSETDLNRLTFADSQFDLVIFRGAFFFLRQKGDLLREVFRILRREGLAFIGGGFGKGVPGELLDAIADESRTLNNQLGRKKLSIKELEAIVRKSGLTDKCRIEDEGGLWLVIRK